MNIKVLQQTQHLVSEAHMLPSSQILRLLPTGLSSCTDIMYLEAPNLSSSKEPNGHQEPSPPPGNGESSVSKQGEAKNEQIAESRTKTEELERGKTERVEKL